MSNAISQLFRRHQGAPETRERLTWARTIDRLIADANRPRAGLRAFRPLAHPVVVAAMTPALNDIASALRDEHTMVSRAAVRALHELISDGAGSPLYGNDPLAARRFTERIRSAFVGQPEGQYVRATHAA